MEISMESGMESGMEEHPVLTWTKELAKTAGVPQEEAQQLFDALTRYPDIWEEYVYYAVHLDFACKVKICGYTVVDVMIWQMDHFKKELDMGKYEMKDNQAMMVFRAFQTFLAMKEHPEGYVAKMQQETGTDYVNKF